MTELINTKCPECEGNGEIICPECKGSGRCSAESSIELSWDSGFSLDSIMDARNKTSRGYPFCISGKCAACNGKGTSFFSKCSVCNGTGKCPICQGKEICRICNGRKKIKCKTCKVTS